VLNLVRRTLRRPEWGAIIFRSLKTTDRSDLLRLGSSYGGWWVPTSYLSAGSVCYCGGVGTDISFDSALVRNYNCQVWAFDPTPQSRAWLSRQPEMEGFNFVPVGLWERDTTMRFYAPANPQHVSHSIGNTQGTSSFFEADCRRISSIMAQLGHDRIDLLKLDIEGAEGPVLSDMFISEILPTVVCVEFDRPEAVWHTRDRVRSVMAHGYELVWGEGWNFTFVRA
jgi:FkbM family methyltransferase